MPSRIIPLPVLVIQHSPLAFAYSDTTETFDDDLGLPRAVTLFTSRKLFEGIAGPSWRSRELSGPDGVRKFHYEVTEATNFFGWHLPLRFEFSEDLPRELGGLRRALSGSGRVLSIENRHAIGTVFDTSLKQTVVDWRFKNDKKRVDALVYVTTNSSVLPVVPP